MSREASSQVDAKQRALDLFNIMIQREIVCAEYYSQEIALELAQIKFDVNQKFDAQRRAQG